MFDKINILEIVKNHISTLVDARTKKAGLGDYLLFYIIPIVVSTILLLLKIKLDKDAVAIISGSLSLFVGLFFNIIVLIFDLISRDDRTNNQITQLREVIHNISFIILLSIVCIIFSFISLADNCYIQIFGLFFTYALCILFLNTVLMILKRMNIFFDAEIQKKLRRTRTLPNSSNATSPEN